MSVRASLGRAAVCLSVVVLTPCLAVAIFQVWMVDKNTPPSTLAASAENVIQEVHLHLNGDNDGNKLKSILERDVSIYYLMGPNDEHPSRPLEYHVGLYELRWHAGISPIKRAKDKDAVYEVWKVHYGGGGRWRELYKKNCTIT